MVFSKNDEEGYCPNYGNKYQLRFVGQQCINKSLLNWNTFNKQQPPGNDVMKCTKTTLYRCRHGKSSDYEKKNTITKGQV